MWNDMWLFVICSSDDAARELEKECFSGESFLEALSPTSPAAVLLKGWRLAHWGVPYPDEIQDVQRLGSELWVLTHIWGEPADDVMSKLGNDERVLFWTFSDDR